MKQVIQHLRSGSTEIAEIPIPKVTYGTILIKSHYSLLSSGTEKMLLDFGKAGYISKARQQPDKVRLALSKMKNDGVKNTVEVIFNKLNQPLPLGYCNYGEVIDVGEGVSTFKIGDKVISNGKHAEYVCVPENLCSKVPKNVSGDNAVFSVLGSIALQGIRLLKPTLGESIAVFGLGLIGLLTVQLLRANGCRVIGFDFNDDRIKLAKSFGAKVVNLKNTDYLSQSNIFSRGNGVDGAILTTTTDSNMPLKQAANISRKRGRIVLVGTAGLNVSRADFYEKELTFQVSCSYGPGRYDRNYEEKGQDYPIGYVRWTEQRNFEAILDMMSENKIDLKSMISHRIKINEANKAYDLILKNVPTLGILLKYNLKKQKYNKPIIGFENIKNNNLFGIQNLNVSFVGAGEYAQSKLISAFVNNGSNLCYVCSNNGVSGLTAQRKFSFKKNVTDVNEILKDNSNNIVVIATRHNSHANLVLNSLRAGKHVFVEKPLCLSIDELQEIDELYHHLIKTQKNKPKIIIGFNRRFSPLIRQTVKLLSNFSEPKSFFVNVNAGEISKDHWVHDIQIGGGRVIGECIHYVDIIRHLAGCKITSYQLVKINNETNDTLSVQLSFEDNSIGVINYFSNGNKKIPKERIEINFSSKTIIIDNFKTLKSYGLKNFKNISLWNQNKGQNECVKEFLDSINFKKDNPILWDEIIEVTKVTLALAKK